MRRYLESQACANEELGWRIKDERFAQMWIDPWDPRVEDLSLCAKINTEGLTKDTFDSLLDSRSNTWDESTTKQQ